MESGMDREVNVSETAERFKLNTEWNQNKEKEANSNINSDLIFQGVRVILLKIPLKDKEEKGLWGGIFQKIWGFL